MNHEGKVDPNGIFITPAVIRIKDFMKAKDMRCIQEENFFPLIPLIKVSSNDIRSGKSNKDMVIFNEMVKAANSNPYGLRVSVWVGSPFYLRRFVEHIDNSGLLRINSQHIGFSPRPSTE